MARETYKNAWSSQSFLDVANSVNYGSTKAFDREASSSAFWDGWNTNNWSGGLFGWVKDKITNGDGKRRAQANAQLTQILNAQEDLTDKLNQSKELTNLQKQQALENLNYANSFLQTQTEQQLASRDSNIEYSSNLLSEQSAINADSLHQMKVSAGQAEQSAMQNVATSGFRNTGTADNNVAEAQRINELKYNAQQKANEISQYSSMYEARNAYMNSTYTAQGYQRQIESNTRNFTQSMQMMDLQAKHNEYNYNKEMDRYTGDIADMKSANQSLGQYTAASFFSDLFTAGGIALGVMTGGGGLAGGIINGIGGALSAVSGNSWNTMSFDGGAGGWLGQKIGG